MDHETRIDVALLGQGPVFERVLDSLSSGPGGRQTPFRLRAVAGHLENGGREKAENAGAAVFEEPAALFDSGPSPAVVFAIGDDALFRMARERLGDGVPVLDAAASSFLLDLAESEALCGACRMDLTSARTLLATIINQLKEDVLLLDTEGRIVDCNANVYERKGLSKSQVVGRFFSDVLDREENLCMTRQSDCPFSTTIRTGRKAEGLFSRLGGDGRVQYVRVYTYPVCDAEGRMTHVAEIRRDITRRTHMEQRLQQSERLAAIGELSTYIAHEIRNPLFAISGFANSLLRSKQIGEAEREKVSIILEESRRLDGILKSIINFIRPTEGVAGQVDLNQVVTETMNVLRIGCEVHKVALDVRLGTDVALAKGDPELIKQCLINLVKNAQQAMPEGGTITVTTGMTARHCFVKVSDTGEGIGREDMDKVFSPFYSTRDKGSGLGLAQIKKIVDDIGGEVELTSRVGKGTEASILLPPLLAVPEDGEGVGE